MANMTPEEFMEQYGQGDPEEFKALLDEYSHFIREVAQRFMSDDSQMPDGNELQKAMSYDAFIESRKKDLDK